MFLSLNVAMDVQPRYFKYIDITDPFKVAAVATPDVSNCSGFLIWDVKFPLRKFSTKVLQFIFYFGRMPQLSFIISKTKNCLFLYTKYNFVLYCIIYCTSFLSFQFPWIIWIFENDKCRLAIDGATQGSMNWPVDHSCNRAFCYKLPVLYNVFYLLFKC